MNLKLKSKIYDAIEGAIQSEAKLDRDAWQGWLHPRLTEQMTNAAESVFDSCMEGQKFAKEQN